MSHINAIHGKRHIVVCITHHETKILIVIAIVFFCVFVCVFAMHASALLVVAFCTVCLNTMKTDFYSFGLQVVGSVFFMLVIVIWCGRFLCPNFAYSTRSQCRCVGCAGLFLLLFCMFSSRSSTAYLIFFCQRFKRRVSSATQT